MEIVVQSKGKAKDYTWLDKDNKKTYPPNQISEYLDTEDASLILVRADKKLILAITSLESKRTDNRTRTIRNSVIWTVDKSEENQLHSLILQYLKNIEEIRTEIDQAIDYESENGFKFDAEKLPKGDPNFTLPKRTDNTKKIGNLDKFKQDLIKDLEEYQLPKRNGLLIFISEIKSQESLEKLKPWRGLSTQINSNDWIPLGGDMTTIIENVQKKPSKFGTILLAIGLAFSLILNGYLFIRVNDLEKRINQIDSLEKVIENSVTKLQQAEDKLEGDITTAKTTFNQRFETLQKDLNEQFKELQTTLENDIKQAETEYEKTTNEIKTTLDNVIEKIQQNS